MTIADSSTVAFVLIDGKSMMGVTTEIKDNFERHTKEMLFLGDTLKRKPLTGVSSGEIEQNGVFDEATGAMHTALKTPSNDRVFSWGACGNVIDKHFVGALLDQVNYNPMPIETDGFVLANAKYSYTQHNRGLIVAHLVSRGAADDTKSTYADLGAGGPFTTGGVGYLQLTALALGGYTNIVVTIAHSPDHSSWATLMSFTAKTAIGAQRLITATNPIERYLAITWAYTGAGAGPTNTLAVGFATT